MFTTCVCDIISYLVLISLIASSLFSVFVYGSVVWGLLELFFLVSFLFDTAAVSLSK